MGPNAFVCEGNKNAIKTGYKGNTNLATTVVTSVKKQPSNYHGVPNLHTWCTSIYLSLLLCPRSPNIAMFILLLLLAIHCSPPHLHSALSVSIYLFTALPLGLHIHNVCYCTALYPFSIMAISTDTSQSPHMSLLSCYRSGYIHRTIDHETYATHILQKFQDPKVSK